MHSLLVSWGLHSVFGHCVRTGWIVLCFVCLWCVVSDHFAGLVDARSIVLVAHAL
eukprot:m.7781 g.7781  ORF g.7781 m.7781 type:complete len:55 (-) comp5893_c0_seq2:98-262(-)